MCSMSVPVSGADPNDEEFSSNTRAFELRNDYWAEENGRDADDGSNDWMDTKWGRKSTRKRRIRRQRGGDGGHLLISN